MHDSRPHAFIAAPRPRAAARPWQALTILGLMAAAPALAQWSTESPLPTHLAIRGVAAPTAGRVFLATEDDSFDASGALFESSDGGASWVQRDVPFDLGSALNGVFFLDEQHGWAWGNANYRTTDGGATWTEMPFLGSAYFMRFYSASFGVATGNFGAYLSGDGGLTWAPSPDGMHAFAFADALTGLGVADTGLYRTTNGGATFSLVKAGVASAVVFMSPTVAVGVVDDAIVRSGDGGLTWTSVTGALGRSALLAVSADVVLAWGRSGALPDYDDRILRSADGGQTWADLGEVIAQGEYAAPLAFVVPAASVVVVDDGGGNLYRSADAGATWTQTFSTPGPAPGFLSSGAPAFADALTGYCGFGAGFIIKTTDGGVTWTQISGGSGTNLLAMDRFANGDLVAVGEAGQVLTRAAGAAPWRLRTRLGTADLVAVQVVGPQAVVAVGSDGVVYRSADAGGTWAAASAAPPALTASELYFETALAGWVIGQGFNGAALFHTTDGGASWTPVPDFQGTYVAVDFVGASGWAASFNGSFYRTVDHGATWSEGTLPGSAISLGDMDFWSSSIGYAVGGGYAARTADGGLTWQILPTPNNTDVLTDIELLGPNELWVSSLFGVVMYSATGGQSWAVMDAGAPGYGSYSTVAASPTGDAWVAGFQGTIRHFAGPPPPPVNQAPIASFAFATTGLSVALTDTSTDNDGTIASWQWTFGDGATATEQHPTHLFASADTYHVALTVTDDDGASGGTLRLITVQPGPGGTFGDFTEVTPLDPLFITPQDEDFWVSTAAPADYDGDGDLDIAVLGFYVVYNVSVEDRLVLLRNDGAGGGQGWGFSYLDVPLGSLSVGASDLAWGDVDGDGDQDLAVGSDGQTVLYRNDGGALTPSSTVLPGYWEDNDQADFDLRSISWADYDNDGDLDLLLPSVWEGAVGDPYRTALLRNDGSAWTGGGTGGWTFTEVAAGFAATSHAQSSWADFDGDQDLDLLLVNIVPLSDEGFIRRYRNDGNDVFVGEDILGPLTVERGEAQWGDYDADGDLDVLVAGIIQEVDGSYATVLRLYRNDAGTWVPIEALACPACDGWVDLSAATWADYDSDGDIDILLAGTYNSGSQIDGRAQVYSNQNGGFVASGTQLPAPRASGSRGGSFSWLDVDGDGDLDYFIAGQYFVPGGNGLVEAQMHLYQNRTPTENQAPSPPSALSAEVPGNGSVLLRWSPASDDHTPSQALTYELRLYLGGVPVSIPRRAPEPGGLSAASEWALSGLPEGSYSWTLEAVDSAFNNGPAAGGNFVVGTPNTIFTSGFESGNATGWSGVSP